MLFFPSSCFPATYLLFHNTREKNKDGLFLQPTLLPEMSPFMTPPPMFLDVVRVASSLTSRVLLQCMSSSLLLQILSPRKNPASREEETPPAEIFVSHEIVSFTSAPEVAQFN